MEKFFTNPYNFVPLEGTCRRSSIRDENGEERCYTGYFDCRLELLRPLLIPNTSWDQALCNSKGRNVSKSDNNYPKGYEFYSYEDLSEQAEKLTDQYTEPPKEPVIPGSEIRGPVRSVYEAAFNGCMSTVDVDMTFGRRSPLNKTPGILHKRKNGSWSVIKCRRAMLYVDDLYPDMKYKEKFGTKMALHEYLSLEEGQKIWIKLSPKCYTKNYIKNNIRREISTNSKVVLAYYIGDEKPDSTYIQGWIHKGEYGKNKHNESVFYQEADEYIAEGKTCRGDTKEKIKNEELKVDDNQISLYRMVLQQYQDPKINKQLKGRHKGYKNAVYEPGERDMPVYFTEINNAAYYLSPACIGKELYSRKLGEILEENGGYQPCADIQKLCPACRLFGMVSGKDGQSGAISSRVRFTDATLVKKFQIDNYEGNYSTIKVPETAGPKPSAVEFYTKPPYPEKEPPCEQNGYWTYDYRCTWKGRNIKREMLQTGCPEIRGRKFYWHSKNDLVTNEQENSHNDAMRQTMRALKASGADQERWFQFRVYFERLDAAEVEKLRWSLDFNDKSCAHKIGHGKPLGFGSARIHIEALKFMVPDFESGLYSLKEADDCGFYEMKGCVEEQCNPKIIQAIKTICSWERCPEDVSYPKAKIDVKSGDSKIRMASYEWFTVNKKGQSPNTMQPLFHKVLPKPEEEVNKEVDRSKRLSYKE